MSYPEWRAEEQSPVWATGAVVTALTFVLALVGTVTFGLSLAEISPWLAVPLMVIIIGCSAPTVWSHRTRPVLRWVIFGLIAGEVIGAWCLLLSWIFTP